MILTAKNIHIETNFHSPIFSTSIRTATCAFLQATHLSSTHSTLTTQLTTFCLPKTFQRSFTSILPFQPTFHQLHCHYTPFPHHFSRLIPSTPHSHALCLLAPISLNTFPMNSTEDAEQPRIQLLDDSLRDVLVSIQRKRGINRPTATVAPPVSDPVLNIISSTPITPTTTSSTTTTTPATTHSTTKNNDVLFNPNPTTIMPLQTPNNPSLDNMTHFDPIVSTPIDFDEQELPMLHDESFIANLSIGEENNEDFSYDVSTIPQGHIDRAVEQSTTHQLIDQDLKMSRSFVIEINSSDDDNLSITNNTKIDVKSPNMVDIIDLLSSSDDDYPVGDNIPLDKKNTQQPTALIHRPKFVANNNYSDFNSSSDSSDFDSDDHEAIAAAFLKNNKNAASMHSTAPSLSNKKNKLYQLSNDEPISGLSLSADCDQEDKNSEDDKGTFGFISLKEQREIVDLERDARSGLINVTTMHKYLPSFLPPWILPNQVDLYHYYHASTFQRLHNEIVLFVQYLMPKPSEITQRNELIDKLRRITTHIFPQSTLEVFGSSSTGTQLPFGDVDLVLFLTPPDEDQAAIDHRQRIIDQSQKELAAAKTAQQKMQVRRRLQIPECQFSRSTFELIALYLQNERLAVEMEIISRARIPVMKFVDKDSGLHVDITLNSHTGTQAARFMQEYLDLYPQLLPLTLVIKYFLHIRGLNDTFTGGIGSFVIQCMLIALLQRHPSRFVGQNVHYTHPKTRQVTHVKIPRIDTSASNLGILLFSFFRMYCFDLNYHNIAIDISATGAFKAIKSNGYGGSQNNSGSTPLLSIMNPHDMSHDISANSFNFYAIRAACLHSYHCILNHIACADIPPSTSSLTGFGANRAETSIFSTLLSELLPVCPELAEIRPHLVTLPKNFIEPRQIVRFNEYCLETVHKSAELYLSHQSGKSLPSSMLSADSYDAEKLNAEDDEIMAKIKVDKPSDISLDPIHVYLLLKKAHSTQVMQHNQLLHNLATDSTLIIPGKDGIVDIYDEDSTYEIKTKRTKFSAEEQFLRKKEAEESTTPAHLYAAQILGVDVNNNKKSKKDGKISGQDDYDKIAWDDGSNIEVVANEYKKKHGNDMGDSEADECAEKQRKPLSVPSHDQKQLKKRDEIRKRTDDGFIAPSTADKMFPTWYLQYYKSVLLPNISQLPQSLQDTLQTIEINTTSRTKPLLEKLNEYLMKGLEILFLNFKNDKTKFNRLSLLPYFNAAVTKKEFRKLYSPEHYIKHLPFFKLEANHLTEMKQSNEFRSSVNGVRETLKQIKILTTSSADLIKENQELLIAYINYFSGLTDTLFPVYSDDDAEKHDKKSKKDKGKKEKQNDDEKEKKSQKGKKDDDIPKLTQSERKRQANEAKKAAKLLKKQKEKAAYDQIFTNSNTSSSTIIETAISLPSTTKIIAQTSPMIDPNTLVSLPLPTSALGDDEDDNDDDDDDDFDSEKLAMIRSFQQSQSKKRQRDIPSQKQSTTNQLHKKQKGNHALPIKRNSCSRLSDSSDDEKTMPSWKKCKGRQQQ